MDDTMDLEQFAADLDSEPEALAEVVAMIRPLPQELAPSEEFMEQTRLRLLELPRQGSSSQQQAA